MKTDMERLNLEFSPRARGCLEMGGQRGNGQHVFPACAGMFLFHPG